MSAWLGESLDRLECRLLKRQSAEPIPEGRGHCEGESIQEHRARLLTLQLNGTRHPRTRQILAVRVADSEVGDLCSVVFITHV